MMTLILIFLAWFVAPVWAQENWEKEWNQLLSAAKKEGTVSVMSSVGGAEPRKGLTESFQKKYGINVDYFSASGSAMVSRIKTERAAGQFQWDIFIGGTSTPMFSLKPDGILDPVEPALILPEVKEGKNWLGGKLEFAEKDQLIFVMLSYSRSPIQVNSQQVKADEIKSVRDLLNPKWKGKIIAADPRFPGPGQETFSFFYNHKDLGPDFLRELAKQDIHFLRDDRQASEWIATGKYPILIGGSDTDSEPFLRQNLPIRIVNPKQLKEGGTLSAGPGGIALMNKAAHPNAAKVYLNWLLSREGQTILVRSNGYPSRRVDTPVPTEPWKFPTDLSFWVSYNEAAMGTLRGKVVPFLKEVFGQ